MDPEYMSNAKLTCASDIYSFGIVTLKLFSGQKVIELDLDARDELIRKVYSCVPESQYYARVLSSKNLQLLQAKDVNAGKRSLTDFEDPGLNREVNSVDFEAILQIAVLCVAKSSKGRPTIDDVFEEIEKAWKNTQAEIWLGDQFLEASYIGYFTDHYAKIDNIFCFLTDPRVICSKITLESLKSKR
ncbi:hypothetical protein NC652_031065 [Populus alba x Populus x berolinensis]|nr:hypothetical protein NC652_031065 [Populus alba x Populus x berolinensis]